MPRPARTAGSPACRRGCSWSASSSSTTMILTMHLPAEGDGTDAGVSTVFDGAAANTEVVTQATDDGARALVYISDPSAPER